MAIVQAMSEQITVIEAGERLAAISDSAVATGHVKNHDRQRHMRRLERDARIRQAEPATVENLTAMGIPVVRV